MACNGRYLDALAVVDDPTTPAYQELRQLTEPKVVEAVVVTPVSIRRAGAKTYSCFGSRSLDGDHIARGFRNGDIREPLFGNPRASREQRRVSATVGRLLKRLHVRQLVAKILSACRRWRSNRPRPSFVERGRSSFATAHGHNWRPNQLYYRP